MKKRLLVVLIIVVIAIIGFGAYLWTGIQKDVNAIVIQDIDLEGVKDGEYNGSYDIKMVSAEVKVKVKDHKIIDIDILKHDTGKGTPAEKITESVINSQSLEVDEISGATASSKVILKAIEEALNH